MDSESVGSFSSAAMVRRRRFVSGALALAKQPGINWKNYSDALNNSRDEPVTTEFQTMDTEWGKVFSPYWQNKRSPQELAAVIAPITQGVLQKAVRT